MIATGWQLLARHFPVGTMSILAARALVKTSKGLWDSSLSQICFFKNEITSFGDGAPLKLPLSIAPANGVGTSAGDSVKAKMCKPNFRGSQCLGIPTINGKIPTSIHLIQRPFNYIIVGAESNNWMQDSSAWHRQPNLNVVKSPWVSPYLVWSDCLLASWCWRPCIFWVFFGNRTQCLGQHQYQTILGLLLCLVLACSIRAGPKRMKKLTYRFDRVRRIY